MHPVWPARLQPIARSRLTGGKSPVPYEPPPRGVSKCWPVNCMEKGDGKKDQKKKEKSKTKKEQKKNKTKKKTKKKTALERNA